MNCKRCGAVIQYNSGFCPSCGESMTEIELNSLGMKWYGFQAYIIMPLSALFNSFIGIFLFPGVLSRLVNLLASATVVPSEVISLALFINSYRAAHMIFAALEIALSIYYAYVSFAMIEYKKTAPKHIYISIVLSQLMSLIYFVTIMILDFETDMLLTLAKDLISSVVSVGFFLFVYKNYYDKRKHLFIK